MNCSVSLSAPFWQNLESVYIVLNKIVEPSNEAMPQDADLVLSSCDCIT